MANFHHVLEVNSYPLQESIKYLASVIQYRLRRYFNQPTSFDDFNSIPLPVWNGVQTPFTIFYDENDLTREEFTLLMIALVPHIIPDFLDLVVQENLPQASDFPQIGGTRGKQFRGFLPTGETALFLIGGTDLKKRFAVQHLFSPDHVFAKRRIFWLADPPDNEPMLSGNIVMGQEFIELFTLQEASQPHFSVRFPAEKIETQQTWEDLVLNPKTKTQIKELETWINFGEKLLVEWDMKKKIKPGYRALFYGPPGTGKTMTASLLGKYTNKPVYKIDLSMVVSKYIGETEKNLANLFAKAEHKDWILFFDEADALFGKRTNVQDAHDRYANQEVSYLLQRVEGYNGMAILASNFKSNIDDAFVRRFQSIVHFPMPKASERLRIWQNAFPEQVQWAADVDLEVIAQKYQLSGAEIMNVVQYTCLKALEREGNMIEKRDILNGIRREFFKEGKVMQD